MITTLLLGAILIAGSQQTGSISGVITDTAGRGLPGAALVATSEDGAVRTTVTDLAGRYRFAALAPGGYRVEASMAGFEARGRDLTVASAREEIWSGALLVGPPLGAGSIERHLTGITGWNARDCGRHSGTASETALERSLQCALASARIGERFAVVVQSVSEASHAGSGLLGSADGVQVFRYDRGGLVFRSRSCLPSQLTLARGPSTPAYAFACGP